MPPNVVIPGTAELVDEVEESKITGEEERYSKLDLPTFLANLEGARAFYDSLEPIVEAKDPALNEQINDAFDAAFNEVNGLKQDGEVPRLRRAERRAAAHDQAGHRSARRAARPRAGNARRQVVNVSRRRFFQGTAAGGAAVAAGAIGVPALAQRRRPRRRRQQLVAWDGPRQAGIVTPRTAYGMVASFDVVTDDLPRLLQDLTARVAELTQGWPDRLDDIDNPDLPPSDTGELGFDKRNEGRLTITLGLGASLFDDRFGLAAKRPEPLTKMPSFGGDNLSPEHCHGDLLLVVQSDHMMVTHHALRDVMRRTKGRLEGRWAQPCFQRFEADKGSTQRKAGVADARGLLGFKDGSQNIATTRDELIFTGAEAPAWARGGSYLALRLIRLKIERWDRLTRTAQEDSIGREKVSAAPIGGKRGGRDADARQAHARRRPHPHGQPAQARATSSAASCAGRSSTTTASTTTACSTPARSSWPSAATSRSSSRPSRRAPRARTWTSTWSPSAAATSSARQASADATTTSRASSSRDERALPRR